MLYGAAEFSRDTDFAILASSSNLLRLRRALDELQAQVIAVPPFEVKYLRMGHAIPFRCLHPEAAGMRIDVMTRMRGVDTFSRLWDRRTSMQLEDGSICEVMALQDLVQAKKTQRDKDWPMIRRLLEVHYFANRSRPSRQQIQFWFLQLRTAELLIELAVTRRQTLERLLKKRPLLKLARQGKEPELVAALLKEEALERQVDRQYWEPLRKELERLRHARLP